MNITGGLSMYMLSLTGLGFITGEDGSRACLSLDKERSLSFLSFFSLPPILLREGSVGRLMWSIDDALARLNSVTEEWGEFLGEVLGEDLI